MEYPQTKRFVLAFNSPVPEQGRLTCRLKSRISPQCFEMSHRLSLYNSSLICYCVHDHTTVHYKQVKPFRKSNPVPFNKTPNYTCYS